LVIAPGLIDIHTHVGLWREVDEQINDANEYTDPFTPQMAALDGIDVRHFSFDLARQGGITTVQTGAGSANPIGGVWSIKTLLKRTP
jgi:imidazolonepropionase-like amidohydrolase